MDILLELFKLALDYPLGSCVLGVLFILLLVSILEKAGKGKWLQ